MEKRQKAEGFEHLQRSLKVSALAADHGSNGRASLRTEVGKSSWFRESSGRVTVLIVVISAHLGLLMLLVRPVIFNRHAISRTTDDAHALKLRFFRPSQPLSAKPALPEHRLAAPAVHIRKAFSARSPEPSAVQQADHDDTSHFQTPLVRRTKSHAVDENSASAGGFQERVRNAQKSYAVHGVPGSDASSVPGIHLIDPMNQGIGAVMRTTQRAFGIENSHCIDVDMWRNLTPQELSSRHVSPGDVENIDEKFDCDEPPGLHF